VALGEEEVRNRFGAHRLTAYDKNVTTQLTVNFTEFGLVLDQMLPDGRDKSLVFTHLEDALSRAQRAVSQNNPLIGIEGYDKS
jgi:hypothetical protein